MKNRFEPGNFLPFLLLLFLALPSPVCRGISQLNVSPRESLLYDDIATEAGMRQFEADRITVVHYPADDDLAHRASRAAAAARKKIREQLGLSYDRRIFLYLVRGNEAFDRICREQMPPWALAAAISDRNAVVVNVARVQSATANDMALAVFHEVIHLALGSVEEGRADKLPRWFHEGVATRLTGVRLLRLDENVFHLAAARGNLIPLDHIQDGFPADAPKVELAYIESEVFIGHIIDKNGLDALRQMIASYKSGLSFDEAFHHAAHITRSELERQWARSFRKRWPWLGEISKVITLFSTLAVATIATFLIVRMRARRASEKWEREEHAWTIVGESEPEDEPDENIPAVDEEDES